MSINPNTPLFQTSGFTPPPSKIRRTTVQSSTESDRESETFALDRFCPVRTIKSSASSSTASSSSSQKSLKTSTQRKKIISLKSNGGKVLRRILVLRELFKDTDQSIFKSKNRVYIGITSLSNEQQAGYLSIETTKEIVFKFFKEHINQGDDSSIKDYNSLNRYLTDNYFFKISTNKFLKDRFLITIPLPKNLITSSTEISSVGHYILSPEGQKKFLNTTTTFFQFLAETLFGGEISPEMHKTLMDGRSRSPISISYLSKQQASEINAPNNSSFGALVDYAVWKTCSTQESLEDGTVRKSDLIPDTSPHGHKHILEYKDVKKIFDVFKNEIYYSESPIEVTRSTPRTKRSAPSTSSSSSSSSSSPFKPILSQTSSGVSSDDSVRMPIGTKEAMHFLVGSCFEKPSLEIPRVESNRPAAEALISLGRDKAADDEATALLNDLKS